MVPSGYRYSLRDFSSSSFKPSRHGVLAVRRIWERASTLAPLDNRNATTGQQKLDQRYAPMLSCKN